MKEMIESFIHSLQDEICNTISKIDGINFREDNWDREGGGGGRSRVFSGGEIFEKAGVNVSVVYGTLSQEAADAMEGGSNLGEGNLDFYATGLSLVLHPKNPMAPTVHANYRYFERGDGNLDGSWWFGGGADLTPSYLFVEDAKHFHQTYKDVCDRHEVANYEKYKKWCDDYFFIKHRGERRGLGGIFFDNLNATSKESCFEFISDCASSFLSSYLPILERRKSLPFDDKQKEWQQIRRGRYVEFNLVYDRGTRFGLTTNGRIESILMSLPMTARWEYCHEPLSGTPEFELLEVLHNPKNWLGMENA